jgi:hypothetical protein
MRDFSRCHRIGLVLLLLSGLCACTAGSDDTHYFPTEPGWRWTYRMQRTTMDGSSSQLYYVEGRGAAAIGTTVPSFEQRTFDGNRYYYQRTPHGLVRVAVQGVADPAPRFAESPWQVFPAELRPGVEWRQPTQTKVLEKTGPPQITLFRVNTAIPVTYRVETFDDVVEVPAGRFSNCMRIDGHGSLTTNIGNYVGITTVDITVRDWYAPGVGLVKSDLVETTTSAALNRGSLRLELSELRQD